MSSYKKSHPIWGTILILSGVSQISDNLIVALLLLLLGCYLIAPNWFINKIGTIFSGKKTKSNSQTKRNYQKSKSDLLKLQSLIFQSPQTELRMSELEMHRWASNICQQKLKILTDSANIVNTTKKPQVFFERYDFLYKTAEELIPYEEFINFSGSTPSQLIEQFDAQRDAAIINLIERAYAAATEKASQMKTEKGRRNQFTKFFESFLLYDHELTNEAKQYLTFLKESIDVSI